MVRLGNNANKGSELELLIKNTCDWYRREGWANVLPNPREWRYTSPGAVQKLPPNRWARTGNNLTLALAKSRPDFSGPIAGVALETDCKEFSGTSLSGHIKILPRHQLESLFASHRAGAAAGYFCWSRARDIVYWLPADRADVWLRGYDRRDADVPRSLNPDAPNTPLIAVGQPDPRRFVIHFAPAIVPGFAAWCERKAAERRPLLRSLLG
jgi:penicillin-binding protein-related factor A (putative recombinase)